MQYKGLKKQAYGAHDFGMFGALLTLARSELQKNVFLFALILVFLTQG